MAKKATERTAKRRPWTKQDVRELKLLARQKTPAPIIARKLSAPKVRLGSRRSNSVCHWTVGGSSESKISRPHGGISRPHGGHGAPQVAKTTDVAAGH